jgi:murein L,D-transpeptidase YafK
MGGTASKAMPQPCCQVMPVTGFSRIPSQDGDSPDACSGRVNISKLYSWGHRMLRTGLNRMPSIDRALSLSCFCLLSLFAIGARADGPLSSSAIAGSSVESGLPLADHVVVNKTRRTLQLMRAGKVLRSYKIALGLRPEGHKQFEGDFRTPEGKYQLTRRNPNSEYFLSIQVSYPNDQDIARARRQGQRPGGAIMIHGQPNTPRKPRDYYSNVDWTEGCIAVSNSDMVEIWLMTPPDTPIEIQP